jgi:hypothetical protein
MAALTDLSDLINRLTGGNNGTPETQFWHKLPRIGGAAATAPIAGRPASAWLYDGYPAGGAVPTAGAIPTLATTGALTFTPAGGGREKFLISAGLVSQIAGLYLLYDRLFHIGGFSGTSTADQTVQDSPASPALTRNTGGEGNIAWAEIYGLLGTTSRTLTMTYTNQAGTGGQTATTNIGSTGFREVSRILRIPLAPGDSGIQAVEKVSLDLSTGTVGDFGITIAQPLAWLPVGSAGAGGWRDYTTGLPGIPSIDPDACLAIAFIPAAATAPEMWAAATFVEK